MNQVSIATTFATGCCRDDPVKVANYCKASLVLCCSMCARTFKASQATRWSLNCCQQGEHHDAADKEPITQFDRVCTDLLDNRARINCACAISFWIIIQSWIRHIAGLADLCRLQEGFRGFRV